MNIDEMNPLFTFSFKETDLDKTVLMEKLRNLLLDSAEEGKRGNIEVMRDKDDLALGSKGSFVFHFMVHASVFTIHKMTEAISEPNNPDLYAIFIAEALIYFVNKNKVVISLQDWIDDKLAKIDLEINITTSKEKVVKFIRERLETLIKK